MKIGEAKKVLLSAYRAGYRKPFLLVGDAGIGKSQIFKQVQQDLKLDYLIDIRLSQLVDSGDLTGLPRPDATGQVVEYLKLKWWPKEGTTGILLFDEINRGTVDMRQCVFQLLTDWRIHTNSIPPTWFVAAAINPDTAGYQVESLDAAMLNRLHKLEVQASVDDWTMWAEEHKVNKDIILFLNSHKDLLIKTKEDGSFPSPRTWTYLGECMDKGVVTRDMLVNGNNIAAELVCGLVGEEATTALIKWVETRKRPVEGDHILNNYAGVREKVLSCTADQLNASISDFILALPTSMVLNSEQVENITNFIKDIDPEYKVLVCKKISVRNRDLYDVLTRKEELVQMLTNLYEQVQNRSPKKV